MSIRISGGVAFALIPHDITAEYDFTAATFPYEISSLGNTTAYIITDIQFYNPSTSTPMTGTFNDTNNFTIPISFSKTYSNVQYTKVKLLSGPATFNISIVGLSLAQIANFGGVVQA